MSSMECATKGCHRAANPTLSPGWYRCPQGHLTRGGYGTPRSESANGRAEGEALKQAALDLHEENHPDKLERAREYAAALYHQRAEGDADAYVTADDVRRFCEREGIAVGPWLGSVFRGRHWSVVGWTTSSDPRQHGTGLRKWRMV